MRQIIISLACCLSTIMSFAQGQTNDALYIYRNDGKFNAFYFSEIDSITTSKLDEFGNEYDDFKSQIVWTQDSVYWIPLGAIDSVSLCKPENKLASGVRRMDDLLPYILDINGMSFKLSSSAPAGLIPETGDILLYESFDDDRFPLGFAGKVKSINNLTIKCDSVNFEDVYDKYVCFGDYAAIEEIDETGKSRRRLSPREIEGNVSAGIDISGTAALAGFYTTLRGSLTFNLRIIYKFEKEKPDYFQLSLSPRAKMIVESGVKGKFTQDFLSEAFNIGIPIPNTPFLLGLKGGPSISMDLEASVTAKAEGEISSDMGLVYENGQISPFFKNTSRGFSAPDISGNIDGSLFAGVHIDFGIYSYGGILSAVIEKETGAEFVMNMSESLADLISEVDNGLNTTKYDALHNVKIDFNLKGSVGGKAEFKLGKFVKLSSKLTIGSFELNLNSWKLLPSFTAPQIDMVAQSKATVSVVPEDKLLPPGVDIGLGIWDKTQYMDFHACVETYRVFNEWPLEKFQTTFEGLKAGHEYEVFPLVWWKGIDMKASPSTTFMTKVPTPAKVKYFEVNNASYIRDGFEYKDKTYYYDYAATTTVELENSEGVEDWGYVYEDPDGEKEYISVKTLGTSTDSRYHYYRRVPMSTATIYGYSKYSDDTYVYEEPKEYDLVYTFHPTAYVGDVIADSITTTSAQFEYGFDDVPHTGKCFVALLADNEVVPIVKSVSYTEKDTIKVADLLPGTTYSYWAYVEYAGETHSDPNGKKSFKTIMPTAYVKDVKSGTISGTSAQFEYGFRNVPENGKCYIAIQAEDEDEIKMDPVSATEKDTYNATDLKPDTKYLYWAYIQYKEKTYADPEGKKSFKTLAPVATTGGSSNITYNSAIVECTYGNVPEGAICGVEYKWNDSWERVTVPTINGSCTKSLTGLKSSTEYTYRAFIEVNGKYFYGIEKTFTTLVELPDLAGTWSCTIFLENKSETTTITLTSNGKATQKGSSYTPESETGNWSIKEDGKVGIAFSWVRGQFNPVYYGESFGGMVNDLSNPTLIEGTVSRGRAGLAEHGNTYKFVMTR